jgi:hypothetical protein
MGTRASALQVRPSAVRSRTTGPDRCRRKFLRFFPNGFADPTYVDWERGYKWRAHEQWVATHDRPAFAGLLTRGAYSEIARIAVNIEARTNLLFSFEKMALRDAVASRAGAKRFAEALFAFLHGPDAADASFAAWVDAVGRLPRKQTRVLTWPVVTVFSFIAQPDRHIFLKPQVTRRAADAYGVDFPYASRPNADTYRSLLAFAERIRRDQRALRPRDMIDLQSFIWVQGSDEYD